MRKDDIVAAMIAHELGERVVYDPDNVVMINPLLTADPMHRYFYDMQLNAEQERRHRIIDNILDVVGYGGHWRTFQARYKEVNAKLREACMECGKNTILSDSGDLSPEQWQTVFNMCFEEQCENNPFRVSSM